MKFNYWMIVVGILLLVIGVYREYPIMYGISPQKNKEFNGFMIQNVPVFLFLVGMLWMSLKSGSITMMIAKEKSIESAAKFMPIIIMLPFLIGFGVALAKFYEKAVLKKLTSRGWPLYCLGAAIISPTSQAFIGVVLEFSKHPSLRPKLMFFMTAVPLMSLVILAIRSMGLGPALSIEVYACNIVCILILLPFFMIYNKIVTGTFL